MLALTMGSFIIKMDSLLRVLIAMTVTKVLATNLSSWSTKRQNTTRKSCVLTIMVLGGVAGFLTDAMISIVKILSLKYQGTIGIKYLADMVIHVIITRTIVAIINTFHHAFT